MTMNRDVFFATLRRRNSGVFGTRIFQPQVEGVEAILDECERVGCDLGQTAYILATGYGESGGKMQPVRENMTYTKAPQIRKTWPTRFKTDAAAQPYVRNPVALANKVYNGRMGNRPGTNDGWDNRGTGLFQMTGADNMHKVAKAYGMPVEDVPEKLMTMPFSANVGVKFMMEGRATGKRLDQYVSGNKRDYLGARAVWGGVHPKKYVAYAEAFEKALTEGGYTGEATSPPENPGTDAQNWITQLIAAILSMFGKDRA